MRRVLSAVVFALFFSACQEDLSEMASNHFQGRDCLYCHNGELKGSPLSFGGTLYSDSGAAADDLKKICKLPLYVQLIQSDGSTVAFDSRSVVPDDATGFEARGNFFVLQRDSTIPTGLFYARLISKEGIKLAQSSGFHDFSAAYSASNSADLSNRYSCNACHATVSNGGATGVLYAQENASYCLDDYRDISNVAYFNGDTFALLEKRCGVCHEDNGATPAGYLNSNFKLTNNDKATTRTDVLTFEVDLNAISNSLLVNCPNDSNHTTLSICQKGGSEYERILDWIRLEAN